MTSAAASSLEAIASTEYLELADEWVLAGISVLLRSAVDRAYYAAFLTARDQLAAKGYSDFDASSRTHGQVDRTLLSAAPELGDALVVLRRTRNRLTYETGAAELPDNYTIQGLLDLARAIIAAVEALPEFVGELPG